MKVKYTTYIDIPKKVYYINYIYDYRDCEYALYEAYKGKFFYDKEVAYRYAKREGLQYNEYDIEELTLGAINKDKEEWKDYESI